MSLVPGVKNLKDTWKRLQDKIVTDSKNHINIIPPQEEKVKEIKKEGK